MVRWLTDVIAKGFLKDSQLCADLFDAIDQISDIIFVCQVYANEYSRERMAPDDSKIAGDRVLKQIPPLYAIVLKFSYQTRKLVNDHGKIGTFFYAHLMNVAHRQTIRSDGGRGLWWRV